MTNAELDEIERRAAATRRGPWTADEDLSPGEDKYALWAAAAGARVPARVEIGAARARATPDAVDYLQGHSLGAGSRGRYIDGWAALPLVATVGMVPRIGAAVGNVVAIGGTAG